MRRGNVDKVQRKKTAGQGFDDAMSGSASGTQGMGFGAGQGSGKPEGLMPLKSPSSAMGDAIMRTQTGKSR